MRDLVILFIHLLTTAARLATRGGLRSVVAESVLLKHQLLILNRSRQRAPPLRLSDRLVAGSCALLMRPSRLIRSAIVLKPSTLLRLHQALRNRKYRRLFSSQQRRRPGPRGPRRELIDAVVQMKQRNPTWGCRASLSRLPWLSPSPSTKTWFEGSSPVTTDRNRPPGAILADLHWSAQGQPLKCRSVPMRIGHVADSLEPGRHGSIHAPHPGVRRPCRKRRRGRSLPDV